MVASCRQVGHRVVASCLAAPAFLAAAPQAFPAAGQAAPMTSHSSSGSSNTRHPVRLAFSPSPAATGPPVRQAAAVPHRQAAVDPLAVDCCHQ